MYVAVDIRSINVENRMEWTGTGPGKNVNLISFSNDIETEAFITRALLLGQITGVCGSKFFSFKSHYLPPKYLYILLPQRCELIRFMTLLFALS